MRAFLQVTTGRFTGKKVWLQEDQPLRVGQSGRANLVIVNDERMSPVHFEVSWDGLTCSVSAKAKSRFDLDGKTIDDHARARNGALIVAGTTSFLVRILSDNLRASLPPPPPDARPQTDPLLTARKEALLLLARETRLFAVLDAARDRRVRALLNVAKETSESLYEGKKAEALADVAPYLVEIPPRSALLDVLVNDAWGESWGIYLVAPRPFKEVRRRLRRFLMVQDEESNKKLYFRFYDPRVLRPFWPTCSRRQQSTMLGSEIQKFILEGPNDNPITLQQNPADEIADH